MISSNNECRNYNLEPLKEHILSLSEDQTSQIETNIQLDNFYETYFAI